MKKSFIPLDAAGYWSQQTFRVVRIMLLLSCGLLSLQSLAQSSRYEAEDLPTSALTGTAHGRSTRNVPNTPDYPDHSNYSGTGFVDGMGNSAAVTFTVQVATAGRYYVTLRYANGRWGAYESTTLDVTATGPSMAAVTKTTELKGYRDPAISIYSPNQYGWDFWDSKTEIFTLEAGTNTIQYLSPVTPTGAATLGVINLDYIWLSKVAANGPIATPIKTGNQLLVKKLVRIPNNPYGGGTPLLNNFATTDSRLFASEQIEGQIYELANSSGGGKVAQFFFDVGGALTATGRTLNVDNGGQHGGLRGVAFHPQYNTPNTAGYRKFYTAVMVSRPTGTESTHQTRPAYITDIYPNDVCHADGVVIEWQYDPVTKTATSSRELFRVGMPVYDHPIKQIDFNPYAQPGDADYGYLYIAHGDGSQQSANSGGGQNDNALGKILRVKPLPLSSTDPDASSFSSPAVSYQYAVTGNPFVANASWATKEVYALGFRNPHTFSFWKDNAGVSRLLVGEAGRDNAEEVNLVESGKNYGWPHREGSFEHFPVELQPDGLDPLHFDDQRQGIIHGIAPLNAPKNSTDASYVYPAAQWGHKGPPGAPFAGQANAGGYVHTAPDGTKQYLFCDFANAGRIFSSSAEELLRTNRQLSIGQLPAVLTQAGVQEFTILYDNNGSVQRKYSMRDVIADDYGSRNNRCDLRFGHGPVTDNTIYIMNKANGWIYQAAIVPASGITSIYEAEDAVLSHPDNMIGNSFWDYRGTGYAENMTTVGRSVTFTAITVPTAGDYLVDLRYSAGFTNGGSVNLYVNGNTTPILVTCPMTPAPNATGSGWDSWAHHEKLVTLQAGLNTLRYSYDAGTLGSINLDYISVRPNTYEAEEATITNTNGQGATTGTASVGAGYPGYRGAGFVENITGSEEAVAFNVRVPAAGGNYTVSLRYSSATGTGSLNLLVDGAFIQTLTFPSTNGSWQEWAFKTFQVAFSAIGSGVHTVEFRHGAGTNGYVNLDYLEIGKSPCTSSLSFIISSPVHNPCGDTFSIYAVGSNLGTDYQWTIDGIHEPLYDGKNGINLLLNHSRPSVNLVVSVSNECVGTGGSTVQYSLNGSYANCTNVQKAVPGTVAMYPNPASTYVQFAISPTDKGAEPDGYNRLSGQNFQVALYDGHGKQVWQGEATDGQLRMDTSYLPIGFYHVSITHAGTVTRQNLSLER